MKANELMIFDLVRRKKDNRTMIVVEVGYDENIGAITTDDRFYGDFEDYHETQVEPIPITPEILEKNGFVMAERDGVAVRYSFATDLHKPTQTAIQFAFYDGGVSADTLFKCWTSPKDCDGINDLHICDLKFVHELQHALRLCGIDKTIVI